MPANGRRDLIRRLKVNMYPKINKYIYIYIYIYIYRVDGEEQIHHTAAQF